LARIRASPGKPIIIGSRSPNYIFFKNLEKKLLINMCFKRCAPWPKTMWQTHSNAKKMYKEKNIAVIKKDLEQMNKKQLIAEAKKLKNHYLKTSPREVNLNYIKKLWELYRYSGVIYYRKFNKKRV
jgi:hypothetical protein